MPPAIRSFSQDRTVTDHRLAPGTVRRVLGYARPYRRALTVFLALIVVDAGKEDEVPLPALNVDHKGDAGVPVVIVKRSVGAPLLAGKHKARVHIVLEHETTPAYNVVGKIEAGAANKLPGVVIVGAHYDHLGLGGHASLAPGVSSDGMIMAAMAARSAAASGESVSNAAPASRASAASCAAASIAGHRLATHPAPAAEPAARRKFRRDTGTSFMSVMNSSPSRFRRWGASPPRTTTAVKLPQVKRHRFQRPMQQRTDVRRANGGDCRLPVGRGRPDWPGRPEAEGPGKIACFSWRSRRAAGRTSRARGW